MTEKRGSAFARGLRDGIPIGLGYLAVAFTLGIAARRLMLTAAQASFGSAAMIASAGEYAAFTLIAAGAGLAEAALTVAIINLRYLLMSCALSQKIEENAGLLQRLIVGYCVTDEIFGASMAVEGALKPRYSYGLILASVPMWVLGTYLGVRLGDILPARLASALGVALYGMFIAAFIPPARENKVVRYVVLSAFILSFLSEKLLPALSPGLKIVILTVLIASIAAALFPVKEQADE